MKTKAYQAKFPDTIPVEKPALAEAISIDGPTLVPHMENPMWCQRSECSARNMFPPFLAFELAHIPMAIRIIK